MNKEEILKEIEKTEEYLATMKKMLEDCKYERWKPKKSEAYYYVSHASEVFNDVNDGLDIDVRRYKAYNCFRTKEQAENEAEKILVRRQLEDIARRLNKGKKLDWSDENQCKWYIVYNTTFGFETYSVFENTVQGVVYCLDKNFKDVAIQEIGEERLKAYLRGE